VVPGNRDIRSTALEIRTLKATRRFVFAIAFHKNILRRRSMEHEPKDRNDLATVWRRAEQQIQWVVAAVKRCECPVGNLRCQPPCPMRALAVPRPRGSGLHCRALYGPRKKAWGSAVPPRRLTLRLRQDMPLTLAIVSSLSAVLVRTNAAAHKDPPIVDLRKSLP
jgi:hypothetical protein